MIEAIAFGIVLALVAACVAISALAVGLPALWRSRDARTDQYLGEKSRADALAVRLAAVQLERDSLKRTVEQRDNEIDRLSADLTKERLRAISSTSTDDLIDRGNGL